MKIDCYKFTVKVTKRGDLYSFRHVLAMSAGGAERICMNSVFDATSAFAEQGWGKNVSFADFMTDGFMRHALKQMEIPFGGIEGLKCEAEQKEY